MRHQAKCCQCPWESKASRKRVIVFHAQNHQITTGHSRIKFKEKGPVKV